MKLFTRTVAAVGLFLASTTLAQAADTYTVHEDHTWVTFSVSHAG